MTDEKICPAAAEEPPSYPLAHRIGLASLTFVGAGIVDAVSGSGPTGLVIGLVASVVAHQFGPEIVDSTRKMIAEVKTQAAPMQKLIAGRSGKREQLEETFPEEKLIEQKPERTQFSSSSPVATTASLCRVTIEEIVANVKRNSFKIYIGRSLTQQHGPMVPITFYKQHFKFIGASQKGKSSMAAAFLEIITRTHDPEHVLVALLDLEDQTSNLFADIAHLACVNVGGTQVPLHARTQEQVLEYLEYIVQVMEERYTLGKTQIMHEPVLLVYIEEFLMLKKYFKSRMSSADDKEQAKEDYARLMYCISEIAMRGLKTRIQLVLCAQVDYADEDFREALASVNSGMSFSVKPTAAKAAGFLNTDLLNQNAQAKKPGQAVVETPDCTDLVLAPEYDLEKKLQAWEKAHQGDLPLAKKTTMLSAKQTAILDDMFADDEDEDDDDPRYQGDATRPPSYAEMEPLHYYPTRPQVPHTSVPERKPALSPELMQTLQAYRDNPGASLRELGKILNVGKDTVRSRLQVLEGMRRV